MLIFIKDLKHVWSEEVLKIAGLLLINMSSRSLANNRWGFWQLVHWCHFSPTPWYSSRTSRPTPPCFTCGPCYYILSWYYIVWPNPEVLSCVTNVSPMNSSGKKLFKIRILSELICPLSQRQGKNHSYWSLPPCISMLKFLVI